MDDGGRHSQLKRRQRFVLGWALIAVATALMVLVVFTIVTRGISWDAAGDFVGFLAAAVDGRRLIACSSETDAAPV